MNHSPGQHYSASFKQDAIKLGMKIGQTKAAHQLGIPTGTMHGWCSKVKRLNGNNDITLDEKAVVALAREELKKLDTRRMQLKTVISAFS